MTETTISPTRHRVQVRIDGQHFKVHFTDDDDNEVVVEMGADQVNSLIALLLHAAAEAASKLPGAHESKRLWIPPGHPFLRPMSTSIARTDPVPLFVQEFGSLLLCSEIDHESLAGTIQDLLGSQSQ